MFSIVILAMRVWNLCWVDVKRVFGKLDAHNLVTISIVRVDALGNAEIGNKVNLNNRGSRFMGSSDNTVNDRRGQYDF